MIVSVYVSRRSPSSWTVVDSPPVWGSRTKTPSATPPHTSFAYIRVIVADVNDNYPDFGPGELNFLVVREEAPVGTHIGFVVATDADDGENAALVYTQLGGMPMIDIHPLSGAATVAASLLDVGNFSFVVSATDQNGAGKSTHRNVQVTITAFEGPAFMMAAGDAPVPTLTYAATVKEDVPVGTRVTSVIAVPRHDGLDRRVAYALNIRSPSSDVDAGEPKFAIEWSCDSMCIGDVIVSGSLDRELVEEYSIAVVAKDFGPFYETTGVGKANSSAILTVSFSSPR